MRTWWLKLHRRWAVLRQMRRPAEWWLFLRVLCFAVAVPGLMRLRLRTLGRLLERRIAAAARAEGQGEPGWVVIRAVESALVVGPRWVRPRCLTRGLTLGDFLRRAGVDLTLCFGAGWREGQFSGHCWLVKDGTPYLEQGDPRRCFVSMYSLPETSPPSLRAAPGL